MKLLVAKYSRDGKSIWNWHRHVKRIEKTETTNQPFAFESMFYFDNELTIPEDKWILTEHLHNWLVEQGNKNYTLEFKTISDATSENGILLLDGKSTLI